MSGLVDALAEAIAQFEGYYKPGSLAQRNRNPGNLRAGPKSIGSQGGYAVYASDADGWSDLRRQVELNINRGLTLREFFGGKPGVYPGYAPAADNNPVPNYVAYVASRAGIDANVPLFSIAAVTAPDTTLPPSAIASDGGFWANDVIQAARQAVVAEAGATPAWAWILLAVGAGAAAFVWMDQP